MARDPRAGDVVSFESPATGCILYGRIGAVGADNTVTIDTGAHEGLAPRWYTVPIASFSKRSCGVCSVCGQDSTTYMRNLKCARCYMHFRRYGVDRPNDGSIRPGPKKR